MAVTTTSLGSNSAKIAYSAGETLTNIMQAINDYIVLHGWELYDDQRSANSYAVYRALNKDGASYKYSRLVYDNTSVRIEAYEAWNNSNHTGTNKVYADPGYETWHAQRLDLTNGAELYVFCNARYLIMESYLTTGGVIGGYGQNNPWIGCIEVSRDTPEDTAAAGYPPYVIASGFALNYTATAINYKSICFPRTRNNETGSSAMGASTIRTLLGRGAYYVGLETSSKFSILSSGSLNPWSGKNYVLTIHVGTIHATSFDLRGRLYGLKQITDSQGSFMDQISIAIDADMFYNSGGTSTLHHILTAGNSRFAVPL